MDRNLYERVFLYDVSDLQLIHTLCISLAARVSNRRESFRPLDYYSAGTFNMPTSYQQWVWEREANVNWSMVTCQGSTRSELP